jgi:predicted MFS family arabinose efflux permease
MSDDAGVGPQRISWRAWYALVMLLLIYICNFMDRSLLGILSEPIRKEFELSDTQLGLLGGVAFASVYTLLGVPVAWLADRWNRRNVLTASLAVWSAMTAVCGFAGSFLHLLLARMGVAAGEAGGSPPSHSMIADLFPPHRRATAMGIFALGVPLGGMIGAPIGGWINEAAGWRTAFIAAGVFGIVLAVVAQITLPEPKRSGVRRDTPTLPIGQVMMLLWRRKSFRYMTIASALHGVVSYGVWFWAPAFLMRSHHLGTAELGVWLFALGFAPLLGTLLGGILTDRLVARDSSWYMRAPALATLCALPFSFCFYVFRDTTPALLAAAAAGLFGSYYLPAVFAMTQAVASARIRAQAASVLLLATNLIGLGFGPQLVGIGSDVLRANFGLGDEALRWSLVSMLAFTVLSAVLYFWGARHVAHDLARAEEVEPQQDMRLSIEAG